jgi:peptidoglycan/xylan/chitin deacetylase (PgdA/CDA1 family)
MRDAPLLRLATAMLSPAGSRARLSTFVFHRVLASPDPLLPELPDRAAFEHLLGWIGEQFRVLAPLAACEALAAGTLPARAAILSFDDGYRDNLELALPCLQARGWQAAFFVATGYLGDGVMFNDRVIEAVRRTRAARIAWPVPGSAAAACGRAAMLPLETLAQRRVAIESLLAAIKPLPPGPRLEAVARLEDALGAGAVEPLMMSAAQVAELCAAGMTLGGHTRSHPILAALPPAQARTEIEAGRDDLRAIVGEAPRLFAYPNGRQGRDWHPAHAQMVREAGFAFAFATDAGAAGVDADPMALPRFTPWDRSRRRFQLRALCNLRARRDAPVPGATVAAGRRGALRGA